MLQTAFFLIDTHCHGTKFGTKIGYNSVTVVIGLATVRKQYFSNKTANIKVQNISLYTC